ncbi:hypothetical protein B0H66DRAFT_329007 [Apodospora peruviana]|uniref:Shugoshin n=1 Tax=Apodospora peruviana TaxID=516989 RepID=A0AAE0HXX1_9PEZI|nr:hypothetical protein B0H66DRAFT_329007 [Apodospora peruviana]
MARLNEQPMAADSLEILRRRFLRQNRDIAKINSNQSLRIRGLENECARLLSENLDLRGQIIRLEKEVEDSSPRRIADHALEIKTKMEAQLKEWGTMLATLGVEPPSKRRSSGERRHTKPRSSTSRSPARRKERDTTVDGEVLAALEGRLPPIYENKPYMRATMNSEQILALCSEAVDSSGNSPDLGPPPVSRYVEDDPVKTDSPTVKWGKWDPEVEADQGNDRPEEQPELPHKLDYGRKPLVKPDLKPEPKPESECNVVPSKKNAEIPEEARAVSTPAPVPTPASTLITKAGAKRKHGDENENIRSSKPAAGKENSIISETTEKVSQGRPLHNRRIIKELPASKRDKAAQSKSTISLTSRTPLSARSTNEDVFSPKKAPITDEIKAAKLSALQDSLATKERTGGSQKPPPTRIEIPRSADSVLSVVTIIPEPDTPFSATTTLISPDTPVRSVQRGLAHDTPPPSDIDSNGETSRPSRRARPAISYAEPNLRDKMRRPTKELFDAVAGEGKFIQRSAAPQKSADGLTPAAAPTSATMIKTESDSGADGTSRRQSTMSPLAQKHASPDTLPNNVVMDRRKRPSTALQVAKQEEGGGSEKEPSHRNTTDVYDFASSSSPMSSGTKERQSVDEGAPDMGQKRPRNSRRSAAAVLTNGESTTTVVTASSKSRSAHTRKRASMLAPKKTAMAELLEYEDAASEDVSADADAECGSSLSRASGKDKISRRRSMML